MIKRFLPLILLLATALTASFAFADDDHLDRLRDAVRRGQVIPLSELQANVREAFPGEIIGVKLDEDDGRFIYEFKVLKANGRLVEIEMDARDGRILDVDDDDDDD